MDNIEQQFEDFIRDITFDDTPETVHRERLEQNLLAAWKQQPRPEQSTTTFWRKIMHSRITKLSVAAAAVIIVALAGWLATSPDSVGQMSSFTLLSSASAAEQALFSIPGGIAHIANEIVLYPNSKSNAEALLRDMESDVTQDKNIAVIKRWLSYQWIPVYSLGRDGQPREHKLDLTRSTDEVVTIYDLAWYDVATGYFARVLKTADHVVFANAYDGQYVYVTDRKPDGTLRIKQEAITDEFLAPSNPADFLGIAAGIRGTVPREHYPPIQDVQTGTLENGTSVRNYKLGYTDLFGKVETYFSFKISTDADVIEEIECVVEGQTSRIHRRIVAEMVSEPELSWNLAELVTDTTEGLVAVDSGQASGIATIRQIAESAPGPVYFFATDPSWTDDRTVYDLPDEMSPSARSYGATYRGRDGRDVVLSQGESFNRYFSALWGKVQQMGEEIPWMYESENGFKVLHQTDKQAEMWWTEFALKSAGFEPKANRIGYIIKSPADTFMVMAVNGPVSEQELHALIDSLVPANEFMPDSDQP